ncbi:MAG TPA: rod shape-determining protein MreC [Terriglobales bacterium]|nr:rod shape-determining protein MreC [Terriglobales bacterium]
MENLLTRHRNVTILVAVLFAEVVGLAVQVKRTADTDSTRLIRVWTVSAVTPLEKAFAAAEGSISGAWHNYFDLRGVRAQNQKLQDEIEQLRLQQVRLAEDAGQARRLQRLLGFKEQFIARTLPAQVIGSSGSDMSRVVYIDKGEGDGVLQDMAVITADGVVGKILRVFPNTSQVLLINDPSSGVGAILEKSRLQGVLKGTANGELVLEKMMSDERVEPGDQLQTSGGDQIFPKGLPIGTVKSVSPGRDVFLKIIVKPAAQLNQLEEVLVITQVVERQPTAKEAQTSMRAADILAARLPSVPENTGMPATGVPLPVGVKPPGAKPAEAKSAAGAKAVTKPHASTAEVNLPGEVRKLPAATPKTAVPGAPGVLPAAGAGGASAGSATRVTKKPRPTKPVSGSTAQATSGTTDQQPGTSSPAVTSGAGVAAPAPKATAPEQKKAPAGTEQNPPQAETPQP